MDKLEEFKNYFLTNKNIWFDSHKKYDKYILENYGNLFDYIQPNIFKNNDNDIFNIMLIFDQLSYYKFRDNIEEVREKQISSKIIAKYFIQNNKLKNFNDLCKVFILLALRHGDNIDDINKSIEIIKKLRINNNSNILKRFYYASLLKASEINNLKSINPKTYENDFNINIIDSNCNFVNFESISQFRNCEYSDMLKNKIKDFNNICVSLSGGVDSMVLLFLLSNIININLYAIHINYKNRDTSDDEMNMCIKFCNYLNIPIFVREINEIKRSRDNDRDLYEEVTRKIRFSFYKIIQDKYDFVITMGHNKDDCIENIFSNIIRKQKYDNLNGMDFYGNELDVNIIRPFLEFTKSDIYSIANYYKLPYLYDSTPSWSDRGKKRDELIPFLNNFDNRIIPGLIEINNRMNMLYKMNNQIINKLVKFINKDNIVCKVDESIIEYDIEFYIDLFAFICKHEKINYFRKRSVINLRNKLLEKRFKNITLSLKYSFSNFYLIKI